MSAHFTCKFTVITVASYLNFIMHGMLLHNSEVLRYLALDLTER